MIERDDLRGRIRHGIEQRGEERLRAEAPPVVANGAGPEGLGQLRVRAAEIAMDGEVDQDIVAGQALADAPLKVFLGAGEPVPIRPRLDLVKEEIGQKATIDDRQRILGQEGPEGCGQRHFPLATGPDRQAGQ